MTKTFRMIAAEIKNVDVIIELLDARIPKASKNPELARTASGKPRLLVLNKSDLADDALTARWSEYYRKNGYGVIAVSSTDRKKAQKCIDAACELVPKRAKPRAMVVGVPNVGKSTFINALAGRAVAKAEDRPGVTRGKQWISLERLELLDVPGVLWKKLENQNDALKLAFTGAIKDGILDIEEIALCLLDFLKTEYSTKLAERYRLSQEQIETDSWELLNSIAKNRGMLLSKGEYDTERAAVCVLDELRAGKLGRITFEAPKQ